MLHVGSRQGQFLDHVGFTESTVKDYIRESRQRLGLV